MYKKACKRIFRCGILLTGFFLWLVQREYYATPKYYISGYCCLE